MSGPRTEENEIGFCQAVKIRRESLLGGVIKGGVAEPLYLGSFVDAIIMRFMRRTSEVQSGRSRSQLLMEGLKLRRPVLLRWFVHVASFHLVRPPWPLRSIASSSD